MANNKVDKQDVNTSLLEKPVIMEMNSFKGYAKLIEIRVEFITIGEVDTMNERYEAEVRIKSRWYDEDIIEEYDKDKHWNPKLFIENALYDVKQDISYSVSKMNDKTIVTETRVAKGSYWERIELQNFPIDVQELSVTIASKLKPHQVKLVADSQKISTIHSEALNTFRDQQKWKLYKMVRVSECASYDMGSMGSSKSISKQSSLGAEFHEVKTDMNTKRPKFVATCCCSRRPGYYLTNCYSFNFLITILSLTIFSIETKLAQNRISGTFTLILTSVSFKFVSNRAVPTVSYMTSLDKYQIINIIYLVMCCVWHSSMASLTLPIESKIIIDKIGLSVFVCIFISIQIVFSIGIIRAYKELDEIKKAEANFINQLGPEDSDDEED